MNPGGSPTLIRSERSKHSGNQSLSLVRSARMARPLSSATPRLAPTLLRPPPAFRAVGYDVSSLAFALTRDHHRRSEPTNVAAIPSVVVGMLPRASAADGFSECLHCS